MRSGAGPSSFTKAGSATAKSSGRSVGALSWPNTARFPGVLRDRLWPVLRRLPEGFSLDHYIDARGHLALPIAKGSVSFVRKIDSHGRIEFNAAKYFVRRKLERQYVVATLSTYHRRVFIKHEGKVIKTFPFSFVGKVVDPIA